MALFDAGKVEIGQANGAFEFVGPVAGQEDRGDMGIDPRDRAGDPVGFGPFQPFGQRALIVLHICRIPPSLVNLVSSESGKTFALKVDETNPWRASVMSDFTIPVLDRADNASLATRLGDMARKAGDLALVALAWSGSWGIVGLAVYGAVRTF